LLAELEPHADHVTTVGTADGADSIGIRHLAHILRVPDGIVDFVFEGVAHS
jgi:hypothetical protein